VVPHISAGNISAVRYFSILLFQLEARKKGSLPAVRHHPVLDIFFAQRNIL
jgi:hypothetical protein